MYDDNYRKRFTSVVAAIYSKEIETSEAGEEVRFTHIHNHHDFEILVIKKGKARFVIDEHTFFAEKGDIILVNPYEIHSAYALTEFMPFSYYCITFDLSLILASATHPSTKICQQMSEGTMKFHNLVKDSEISNILFELEDIFTKKEEGWEFFVSSAMFRIFGLLYKNKKYTLMSTTKNHIFTKKVTGFVEDNFTDNITSTHAAEKLGYDKSYFCRIFRKNFGKSFGEYLNFRRINFATELLRGGSSVSEAAFACGFNNLSYFTKVFKKYNNIQPSKIEKD